MLAQGLDVAASQQKISSGASDDDAFADMPPFRIANINLALWQLRPHII